MTLNSKQRCPTILSFQWVNLAIHKFVYILFFPEHHHVEYFLNKIPLITERNFRAKCGFYTVVLKKQIPLVANMDRCYSNIHIF